MNKKNVMKLFAIVLAVISIFTLSLAVSAFKIEKATGDTHNYKIYQICTGDVVENGTKLTNCHWGDGVAAEKQGQLLTTAEAQAFEAVANTNDTDEVNAILAIAGTLNDANAKDPGDGFVPGYYLVKDADAVTGADDFSLYIVKILNADTTISRKAASAPPKAEKSIVSGADLLKGKTAKEGDVISYKVVCTLPDNLSMYKTYKYDFVDALDPALVYQNDMVIKQGAQDVTSAFTITYANNKITANCADIKATVGNTTTSLEFTYTAKLVNAATINENSVQLTYSNDPNHVGDGTPTGTSVVDPPAIVTVYTSTLIVDPDPDGAVYELKTKDGDVIPPTEPNKWTGLDDGEYVLVEKTTPDGYDKVDDIPFVIETTIPKDGPNAGERTGLTADGLPTPTIDVPNGIIETVIRHNAHTINLPTTGTIGIVLLAGAAAVVTGTAFGIRMKGKKENEEEDA